jgi:hypothetical protein
LKAEKKRKESREMERKKNMNQKREEHGLKSQPSRNEEREMGWAGEEERK